MADGDKKKQKESTKIDLAEDLFEPTGFQKKTNNFQQNNSVSDQEIISEVFKNAQIFFEEELLKDAKENLRKILLINPNHKEARAFYEKIQKKEIEALLLKGEEKIGNTTSYGDLNQKNEVEKAKNRISEIIDHKKKSKNKIKYKKNDNVEFNYREWVDVGISLIELEQYEDAIEIFSKAKDFVIQSIENLKIRLDDNRSMDADELKSHFVQIICLLAEVQLKAHLPYDAIGQLEEVIYNEEIEDESKKLVFKIMSMCLKALGNDNEAFMWEEKASQNILKKF